MTAVHVIILIVVCTFLIQISPIQTISCYTCVDCGDPFNANSLNITQSPSSCSYCYKLTVFMAFAPSRYIVKECVQTCTKSSGLFGGSSLEIDCCTSSLCNNVLGMYYQYTWKKRLFFTIIPSLFMTFYIININQ